MFYYTCKKGCNRIISHRDLINVYNNILLFSTSGTPSGQMMRGSAVEMSTTNYISLREMSLVCTIVHVSNDVFSFLRSSTHVKKNPPKTCDLNSCRFGPSVLQLFIYMNNRHCSIFLMFSRHN